jgi:hypothetical protein
MFKGYVGLRNVSPKVKDSASRSLALVLKKVESFLPRLCARIVSVAVERTLLTWHAFHELLARNCMLASTSLHWDQSFN